MTLNDKNIFFLMEIETLKTSISFLQQRNLKQEWWNTQNDVIPSSAHP